MWRSAIEVAELLPLQREHILAYLDVRGVEEADRGPLADLLLVVTQGNLLDMATHVDGYMKIQERRRRDAGPANDA